MIEKSAAFLSHGSLPGLRDLNRTRIVEFSSLPQTARLVPSKLHTETNLAIRTLVLAIVPTTG